MIPIKNKKKNLEATVEEMRNFAFVYVEKYAPSKQQLRTYLLKKYLKSGTANVSKKNITDLIDVVLEDLEKSKLLLTAIEYWARNLAIPLGVPSSLVISFTNNHPAFISNMGRSSGI